MVSLEESRARTIVIIEWILFGLVMICTIIAALIFSKEIGQTFQQRDSSYSSKNSDDASIQIVIISVLVLSIIFYLLLNLALTKGVHQKNTCMCKTWYIFAIIGIGFSSLGLLASALTLDIIGFLIKGGVICYKIYSVRTIMAFTESILSNTGGTPQHSTGGGIVYSTVHTSPLHHQQQQQPLQPPPLYFDDRYDSPTDKKNIV